MNVVNPDQTHAGDPISELLEQARNGSPQAQTDLFAQVQSYLSLVAERNVDSQLRPKVGASDLVQESLTVAVERFDQFRGHTQQELYAWLTTIIKNELKQKRRSFHASKRDIKREQRIDAGNVSAAQRVGIQRDERLTDQMPTPGTHAVNVEQSRALAIAMGNLPAEDLQVIKLRNWERLSFRQIAEQLGKSESMVTRIWYRALVRLQTEMDRANGRK